MRAVLGQVRREVGQPGHVRKQDVLEQPREPTGVLAVLEMDFEAVPRRRRTMLVHSGCSRAIDVPMRPRYRTVLPLLLNEAAYAMRLFLRLGQAGVKSARFGFGLRAGVITPR